MTETLGSLCDKLTIVKLKQWHCDDPGKHASLAEQEKQLVAEIDEFTSKAIEGEIPRQKLSFATNKVYPKEGNVIRLIDGSIGEVFSQLAEVNCKLWHEQEKVYEFENIRVEDKDGIVKQLAVLNLERNQCIDQIDNKFCSIIKNLDP